MANTIKLGNGTWATKEGSLLAYNDLNNNFKPLPFTTTRASSATVVNRQGLIETVGSGIPRIDFNNNSKGALLLEPTSTNFAVYSEALSTSYSPSNLTQTPNYGSSPDGNLTSTRVVLANLTDSRSSFNNTSLVNGTEYTFSAYYKGVIGQTTYMYFLSSTGGINASKEIVFNGQWQRESITFTAGSANNFTYIVDVRQGTSTASDFEVWGVQIEGKSYPTSYIKTEGNAAGITRAADDSNQTPPSGIIGQTEGTMFLNIKRGVQINNTQGLFGISSASGDNRIIIWNIFTLNSLGIQIKANGANIITSQSLGVFNNGENYKIAVSYKSGEIKGYVNGLQIFNLTNTFTFTSALSEIYLNNYANNSLTEISPINELQIYNTALTDQELQALTT